MTALPELGGDPRRLREALDAAGYDEPGVLAALGVEVLPEVPGMQRLMLLHRVRGGSPRETLVRLLLLGEPVSEAAFLAAVAPTTVEDWVRAGLMVLDGDTVRPRARIRPHRGLLIANDPPRVEDDPLRADFVMGIGSSSITLAEMTVRRPSRRTLDLGTGSGIQALLAAPHSDTVIAADRNPRAVAYARFNALLNGLGNVEGRQGDLFAPVGGERFDLIVSNPPFVISPERAYLYRDADIEGDALCRRVVREGAAHLEPGGFCQLLCNFAVPTGGDWREVLGEWCTGTGCDAWAMCAELKEPEVYATVWIGHTEPPHRHAELFERWMDHYRRRGITAMGSGVLMLRRATGGRVPWFHAEDAAGRGSGDCGDQILRGFELRDLLERLTDQRALLSARLRLSPDARLDQSCTAGTQGWEIERTTVRLTRGLRYQGTIDPHGALLLGRCTGAQPLGDLLAEMSQALGVELESMMPGALEVTRSLIAQGFLVPA
ncbi:MAG TPA: methyltransferase [Candidatus Dormibacteraeota bacterium]|nr:methyltransferase [Candidatus Dormibacteraeota bacterium]